MSSLYQLGWTPFFQDQVAGGLATLHPARIVEEQRELYRVSGDFDGLAEVSGRFRRDAASASDFPVVGDWVGVAAEPGTDRGVIHRRLKRQSAISRKAAGRAVQEQVLAANIDTVFVVTALTGDLNARRLERYLTMVWEAGALPVVLLNKADLSEDPDAAAAAVRERLPFVEVLAVSALNAAGLAPLAPYLKPAATVALLGSSGVGKSTIVNSLLGRDRQRVAAVREVDGKGRHTTTARHLIELPSGALLIDTPGMRELQPWTRESAVGGTFQDIADLALLCRFTDCAHDAEPGCAVTEAVAVGTLSAERLAHYRKLVREAEFEERKRDKAAQAEQKRRWKQLHQAAKALYRDRDRS